MSVLPVPNRDSQWADFSGLYAKALKQASPGVPDAIVFKAFVEEIDRGVAAGQALPVSPDQALLDRVANPHSDTDYLARFAYTYVTYYAGLASAMIALVFLYVIATIFIFGGELNAAYN